MYRETGSNDYEAFLRYTYASDGNLERLKENIGGNIRNTYFAYDADNRVTAIRKNKARAAYTYDSYGRVSKVVTSQYNSSSSIATVLTETYEFQEGTTRVSKFKSQSVGNYNVTYTYTYDENGNILSVSDGTHTTSFKYDDANQLVREDNQAANTTTLWTYDAGGNIKERKKYNYTTAATPSGTPTTYSYTSSAP